MLDTILAFIAALIKKASTTTTVYATVGTGGINVLQFGKIVLLSGQIDMSSRALSNGEDIVRGLPVPKNNNVPFLMLNNNSGTRQVYGFVSWDANNQGAIRVSGDYAAANYSLRLSFAYLAY